MVPNDPTNEARALNLLAAQGIITLKEGVGLAATVKEITDNPKNVKACLIAKTTFFSEHRHHGHAVFLGDKLPDLLPGQHLYQGLDGGVVLLAGLYRHDVGKGLCRLGRSTTRSAVKTPKSAWGLSTGT